MAPVSNDGRELHEFVYSSAIYDSALCALEHGCVSFSRLNAEREFSTAIPSSPGAFKFLFCLVQISQPAGIPNIYVPGDIAAAHPKLAQFAVANVSLTALRPIFEKWLLVCFGYLQQLWMEPHKCRSWRRNCNYICSRNAGRAYIQTLSAPLLSVMSGFQLILLSKNLKGI